MTLSTLFRNRKSQPIISQTRASRRRLGGFFRPHLERLEDRTVPTSITVLASHLRTAGGLAEQVRVVETGTLAKGTDFTFDATPGVYHLTDYDGGGTYGSFTVATNGIISGTTDALVASSSTIDFDLTKLAAVTIFGTDLQTAGGLQQSVGIQFVDVLLSPGPGTDTVYLPAGTFRVGELAGLYGGITVSVNGSGALAVSATSGAAVATGNTIHFDLTRLAAVTVFGTDLKTAGGLQQALGVDFVVSLVTGGSPTDTVYLPAGTYQLFDSNFGAYGSFTVSANSSGALAVSATSGAAVATGNTIHFDLTKLAAVTIFGTDIKTAAGLQQIVRVPDIVPNVPGGAITDTVYCPARTFQVYDGVGHVYGTFTVTANASGSLAVTATSGAAVATGNTIHFDVCKLDLVRITPSSGAWWYLEGPSHLSDASDVVAIPDGSYTLFLYASSGNPPPTIDTFSVSSAGLSATQLPQEAPLVTLELVPCMEPPSLVVTTTADVVDPHDFQTSLREAINYANANPGQDTITFAIPTSDAGYQSTLGAFIIKPTSALPTVAGVVVLDGYTQAGASPNTLTIGDNAVLKIVLDGSLAGAVDGLVITGGNCTVRGLVIDNFGYGTGIFITGGGNNLVVGNFIGTDATGVSSVANNNGLNIYSSGNMVGGISPGDRNLISGNNSGLPNSADGGSQPSDLGIGINNGNLLQGNYIGTDRSGTFALPNGTGVAVGSNNTIGGVTATLGARAGNLISGNTVFGIARAGNQNLIAGNLIGTTATGLAALGNGAGVDLWGNNNTIGGTTAGARNIISGNTGPGGAGVINAAIDIENVSSADLAGGSYNLVEGNYIGTDITGTTSLGRQGAGIIIGGGSYNTIGGTTAAARNVISGNNGGIGIEHGYSGSFGNVIQGNYIGTDASGTQTVPNSSHGILLYKATHDNIIGGTLPGEGNLISGSSVGVWLSGNETGSPTNNRIQGNLIGTDKTGTVALGNSWGVAIDAGNNNTVGGTSAGAANTIVFSRQAGVLVYSGTGNSIRGNSIHDNAGLGIDLGQDGVTPNDPFDADTGPNNLQNFPVLAAVYTGTSTRVVGSLKSAASTTFSLDFYADSAAEPSGFAQGKRYLGSTTVTTNGTGNASFDVTLAAATAADEVVTATATDPGGNTSEFFQVSTSLSGTVFVDFNDDGQIDFGERGLAGVAVALTGTDDLGNAVNLSQTTDADGAYVFLDLRPGSYYLTETQPADYLQGSDTIGSAGGSLVATDQFFVQLAQGVDAMNYNYGERPPASGSVHHGQTATIGFWNNRNGQALIRAVNGGTGHQLGDWLAATLPNIFGAAAGSNNLALKSNAAVATLFQSDFLLKGVKLDAQVLATALSVYVTNAMLDPTQVAAQYGFTVSGDGVGTATVNVGSNGAAFGVADNSVLTVMDLLLATDAQAVNGVLYGGNTTKRNKANNIYSFINQAGDIG